MGKQKLFICKKSLACIKIRILKDIKEKNSASLSFIQMLFKYFTGIEIHSSDKK